MGMGRIFQKLSSSFTRLELRKINAGAGMEWGWAGYMNCMCLLLTDQDPKILESSLQAPSLLSLESPAEKKPEGTGE